VPITAKVVIDVLAHGELYLIQTYIIKVVNTQIYVEDIFLKVVSNTSSQYLCIQV